MILRDIALGRRPDLAEAATIVFVPIYNADGHENVSPYHRANQNGPADAEDRRRLQPGRFRRRAFKRGHD